MRDQRELLIDRGDALVDGFHRVELGIFLAFEDDGPGRRHNGAGDRFDQRGLACAVFAGKRVHLASAEGDGYIVQRFYAGIVFAKVSNLKYIILHLYLRKTCLIAGGTADRPAAPPKRRPFRGRPARGRRLTASWTIYCATYSPLRTCSCQTGSHLK